MKCIVSSRLQVCGWVWLIVGVLGLLSACGLTTRTRAVFGGKLNIQVEVAPDANEQSPVALDFILIYDKALVESLSQLTAKDWFDKRDQIRRDYPNGKGFEVWGWEWAPGQRVPLQQVPLKAKAKAGLVFANYFSPGEHRASIDPTQSIRVQLHADDFTVELWQ